ncbi:hypothetical protein BGW36DRAFT_462337 [Talaromyces proteolyticus]|uniref:Rhamnogalacturonase A/B/Epimerase-like pectate lyase domain-containing protein n=1 Tax=Talaromyces proteolyticus TaxID=1131652 RepID=A0AAD4PXK9_9EURO|nr:uncharacterized protein BGW36DRAFT_462337 [Talaromyces proteolyticus]KAH8696484.1 hypothetical protein BGW36DRAFT_462337 [Talaromyces proteolyticus]
MPLSTSTQTTTAVGIFMKNGSGGFLGDLEFYGENIGFRSGSQQYTRAYRPDSTFDSVPYPITLRNGGPYPDIVLDNLYVEESAAVVLDGTGTYTQGLLEPAPSKPASPLDGNGNYFTQSRPQYQTYSASQFILATAHGVSNNATRDQTDTINSLLSSNVSSPVFFPAGIYLVKGTVSVPLGSIIVGEGWSQIMATGSYFADESNPNVMVQVGSQGDEGIIQISDMLFTVQGPTVDAIVMKWNVHESTQAAVWDSHFRVGGAQ